MEVKLMTNRDFADLQEFCNLCNVCGDYAEAIARLAQPLDLSVGVLLEHYQSAIISRERLWQSKIKALGFADYEFAEMAFAREEKERSLR